MRKCFLILCPLLVLCFVFLCGCGPSKYAAKADEELYGTWVNDGIKFQKMVVSVGGTKVYLDLADAKPILESQDQIIAKWKDTEGNIWYKTYASWIAGQLKGTKTQYLWKISSGGSQIDLAGEFVKDFNEKNFPASLRGAPMGDHRSYQRSQK